MNYSTCRRVCKALLGADVRIRPVDGGYRIFRQVGDTRTVFGEGATYAEALEDCFAPAGEPEKSSLLAPSETTPNES